jgi:hypothetical protein
LPSRPEEIDVATWSRLKQISCRHATAGSLYFATRTVAQRVCHGYAARVRWRGGRVRWQRGAARARSYTVPAAALFSNNTAREAP